VTFVGRNVKNEQILPDKGPQPSEREEIIFFNCLDPYHKLPDSGERQ